MADTGWVSPGTVVSDDATGDNSWSNPSNAISSNNSYAESVDVAFSNTYYLKATNFGFDIPSGSTINGIEVGIERYYNRIGQEDLLPSGIGGGEDYEVKLVLANGSIGTTNKASETAWEYSDPDSYVLYGGASDLWGESWGSGDVNDVDFGVALSAFGPGGTSYVDHIQIKVYYTESSGPPTVGVKYPLPAFKRS